MGKIQGWAFYGLAAHKSDSRKWNVSGCLADPRGELLFGDSPVQVTSCRLQLQGINTRCQPRKV